MALDHFTAMMAHEFLTNSRHFAKADPEVHNMWRWHATEEIEHKGVAFDVWVHATRGWTPARRWKVRRSEEHTSELQSLMRISYAVFCLKKKIKQENKE